MRALLAAALLVGGLAGPALGCSYVPDERDWIVRLAEQPDIFVGKVIAIFDPDDMEAMQLAECGPDISTSLAMGDVNGTCVVLRIEQKIRGELFKTYEVPQGSGADCQIGYEVGQRWLYAGNFIGGPSQQLSERLSRRQLREIREALGD
jgi:hypothetical protein